VPEPRGGLGRSLGLAGEVQVHLDGMDAADTLDVAGAVEDPLDERAILYLADKVVRIERLFAERRYRTAGTIAHALITRGVTVPVG